MKKHRVGLLAFTLTSMAALAAANAADMYVAPAPAVGGGYKDGPVVQTWTGFYGGINGGFAWERVKARDNTSDTFTTVEAPGAGPNDGDETPNFSASSATRTRINSQGGFGGGQIGYNWQAPGGFKDGPSSWVFGVEADIEGMNISGKRTVAVPRFDNAGNPIVGTLDLSSKGEFYGDFTGRLGYAFDNVLFYAKGGAAFLDSKFDFSSNGLSGSTSGTLWGYTAGGGVEYMFRPNWSLKAEYLHFDFRSASASTSKTGACVAADPGDDVCTRTSTEHVKFNPTLDTVKVGINYHIVPGYEPLK
jgi:outer membrane immunogenic protein